MPVYSKKITDSEVQKLPASSGDYTIYWCPVDKGLGVRVTAASGKSWIFERFKNGKTVRRTLGKASGRAAISRAAAIEIMREVSSEQQQGIDRVKIKREQIKEELEKSITFSEAMSDYVKNKRRAKDGLPLKERTKEDYLAMLAPATYKENGEMKKKPGGLHAIADRSIYEIDADIIRSIYKSGSNQRQSDYSMQVLRAVLNWQGIRVEGNPLSKETAGKHRIQIAQTKASGTVIPPEKIGAWWRAASARDSLTADYLRFLLLTGCRPSEPLGVLVRDVDLAGGRVLLKDTKNRSDHTIILSTQARAIVEKHLPGKRPTQLLFDLFDGYKTMIAIGEEVGVTYTRKSLRATFASIAEQLCSFAVLKCLMNHTPTGDVTLNHYIRIGEPQLREGWQAVGDFIEAQI